MYLKRIFYNFFSTKKFFDILFQNFHLFFIKRFKTDITDEKRKDKLNIVEKEKVAET